MDEDQKYLNGRRGAFNVMLIVCLTELGYLNQNDETPKRDQIETGIKRWVSEREQAISTLRQVCADHGDNEWDETLHLADIIEKHLWRHIEK